MSDVPLSASDEETPSASPTPSTPRPKREWTILGRLSRAVREQNWFAVVLEVCIVIVGVVIGFQVTGWGQERADRVREQGYLRQLVEDLQKTEDEVDRIGREWTRQGALAGKLLRPYRSSSRPPADSVLHWMGRFVYVERPTFVTGTATALVETGDLNLIRSDSLRSAITSYLGRIDQQVEYNVSNYERIRNHLTALSRRVDMIEAFIVQVPPGVVDSLARADPEWPVPEAPERAFSTLDVEAFYRDREAYADLVNVMQRMYAVRIIGAQTLASTVALREQIEAELNR